MNILALIAITWIGKEYRFFGLDWSYLMVLGFIGNALFSMRFLVQWLASERQGKSIIPVSFWYWSIAGSVLMCIYFIFRRDPVGILAYLPNSLIYIRNLMLIRKHEFAFTAAAPSQHPVEQSVSELSSNDSSLDAIAMKLRPHAEAITLFCATIEHLAGEKTLNTDRLEGAHYSAMTQLREKIVGPAGTF
ncbi:MAG TPA: lipid-A-disaccharide synthase N-terminal domain-containing protein [Candidatus Udaeobacter sp.]|jgi:lipid-A-disaccharide synthase-like uncharacterized protein|nr:lipid-A-disaccharide synthase N-terminal domain-containing protein [Candidatus Udaeobacter sp.]